MRILFCLLFYCGTASGQSIYFPKDSSVVKMLADLPAAEPFDTAHTYNRVKSQYVYIISDNDVFSLFGWEIYKNYQHFNFDDYHILGTQVCKQCELFCHHDQGQTACHRNRCSMGWVWMMRENSKAFTEVPSLTRPGHSSDSLPVLTHSYYGDTIIQSSSDITMAIWFTSGHGDCFATFRYAVFADTYHPVLLLKEWSYNGGCRGGGSWDFTIGFTMPPGISHREKSTILVQKKYN